MKYNAVKHAIETDNGREIARLEPWVTAEEGYRMADGERWDDSDPSGIGPVTRMELENGRTAVRGALDVVAEALNQARRSNGPDQNGRAVSVRTALDVVDEALRAARAEVQKLNEKLEKMGL